MKLTRRFRSALNNVIPEGGRYQTVGQAIREDAHNDHKRGAPSPTLTGRSPYCVEDTTIRS